MFSFLDAMLTPNTLSRFTLMLTLAWVLLAGLLGYEIARGASFQGALAFPALLFLMSSALLGSRLYERVANPAPTGDA